MDTSGVFFEPERVHSVGETMRDDSKWRTAGCASLQASWVTKVSTLVGLRSTATAIEKRTMIAPRVPP